MQPPHHVAQIHPGLVDHQPLRQHGNRGRIREVWKHNLEEEMAVLRDLVDKYPYIAMVSGYGIRQPDILTHPSLIGH
jgi:CCR4-NOT transcription complex subunit 7/8